MLRALSTTTPLFGFQSAPGSGVSGRALAAASHYAACMFYAAKTATIDRVVALPTAQSSPVLQLEAAITNLDANGYPGTDVAVSSTTFTSFTNNTPLVFTISAAVTEGTLYLVVVRPKAYTSGSVTISHMTERTFDSSAYDSIFPAHSFSVGTPTKIWGAGAIAVRYGATDTYLPTMGLGAHFSASGGVSQSAAGNVIGNKFRLRHRVEICGYLAGGDFDGNPEFALFAGSDNTALAGSTAAITSAYRSVTTEENAWLRLAAKLILNPGTYRVGMKNVNVTANTLNRTRYIEAGCQKQMVGDFDAMRTDYASGAWTDSATELCLIAPLISAIDSGLARPSYHLGM